MVEGGRRDSPDSPRQPELNLPLDRLLPGGRTGEGQGAALSDAKRGAQGQLPFNPRRYGPVVMRRRPQADKHRQTEQQPVCQQTHRPDRKLSANAS